MRGKGRGEPSSAQSSLVSLWERARCDRKTNAFDPVVKILHNQGKRQNVSQPIPRIQARVASFESRTTVEPADRRPGAARTWRPWAVLGGKNSKDHQVRSSCWA